MDRFRQTVSQEVEGARKGQNCTYVEVRQEQIKFGSKVWEARIIKKIFIVLLLFTLWSIPVFAQDIKVSVDGEYINFDVKPVLENGSVLVPVRGIFEKLGAQVNYLAESKKILINNQGINIELILDDRTAKVNDFKTYLTTPPKSMNGRTLIPLRFASEYLGADVSWDQGNYTVFIKSKNEAIKLLNQAFLTQYGSTYITNHYYSPARSIPFSFSGSYSMEYQSQDQRLLINAHREGRIKEKFYSKTIGTGSENGMAVNFQSEQLYDFATYKSYRNQGNGWSRYDLTEEEIENLSGFRGLLMTLFNKSGEQVKLEKQKIESKEYYVVSCNFLNANTEQARLLIEILKANFEFMLEAPDQVSGQVKFIIDPTSLLIIKEEMNIAFKNKMYGDEAKYRAEYSFNYDNVVVVQAITESNVGLKRINDLLEQERYQSFEIKGEIDGKMQIEGVINKGYERYLKLLYGNKLMIEQYLNWQSKVFKYKDAKSTTWKEGVGYINSDIDYLVGNKHKIINLLNHYSATPIVTETQENGKIYLNYEFDLTAAGWGEGSGELVDIILDNSGMGYSFDVNAQAKFIFKVDSEKNFISELTAQVKLIDGETETLMVNRFDYDLNNGPQIPPVE